MAKKMTGARRPVLPALRDQSSFDAPPKGEWNTFEPAYLEKLGRDMKAEVDGEYFDVDAIPDVWARPLLFQMALYDASHPLHERMVSEWRGLAALIALTDWRSPGERLRAVPVDFHDGTPFLEAAFRVRPRVSLFGDTHWDGVHALLYKNRSVGMTSPTTLFCTSSDYVAYGVAWFSGRRFHDPLRVPTKNGKAEPKLNGEERKAVAWWLERLRDDLDQHEPFDRNMKLWDDLQGQIQSFLDDLGPSGAGYALQPDVLALTTNNALRYLDEVPGKPGGTPDTSDVLLRPTEGSGAPSLLILDRSIADRWGVAAQDVKVWGGTSLETAVPPSGMTGSPDKLGGEVLGAVQWRNPLSFFLDRIAVVESANAFVAGHVVVPAGSASASVSPLLPLTEELLGYLPAAELAARVSVQETSDRGYEVSLRLPLSGRAHGDGEFLVTRRYASDDVHILEDVPTLEVWPNFVSPGWSAYYTFTAIPGKTSFLPRPVSSAETRTHSDARGTVESEVTVSDTFPDVLACTDASGGTPYGLLVLSTPPDVPVRGGQWTVGVDFGTTNTTVFVNDGTGQTPLEFEDRLWQVTNDPSRALRTRKSFFSPEGHVPPFRTLYLESADARYGSLGQPVLDGHVLYLSDEAYEANEDLFGSAHADLKWSDESHDRELARRFLAQVVLQARAEAAARGVPAVRWRYSVPTSFSRTQNASVEAMWDALVGGQADQHTESMATAAYFYDTADAALSTGAVCLDIGGMSSDVALWKGHQTQLQTSVRLASRDILVSTLHALPDVQQTLFGRGGLSGSEIETGLALRGSTLWNALRTHEEERDFVFLRQQVSLGLGGLIYYVGMLADHVGWGGADAEFPRFYVGGNGARMLHWVANGAYSDKKPVNDLFSALFQASSESGGDGRLSVRMTRPDDIKREVGHGLVMDHNLETTVSPVVLAGERFEIRGEERGHLTEITPRDVVSGLHVDPRLPTFREFLATFDEQASGSDSVVPPVEATGAQLQDVANVVANRSQDNRHREPNEVYVEPLFVTSLRALLDARWTSRSHPDS